MHAKWLVKIDNPSFSESINAFSINFGVELGVL
jgi:hypothetical protein